MSKYNRYTRFRQDTYQLLGNAKDATFDLMDSIMTTRNAYCLADLSLSPFFRRKWHSTYESLEDCRPNRNQLMKRYVQEIPELKYVLLAIDHTAWELKDAKTMKDRSYQDSAASKNGGSSLLFMLNQQTRCQDNILLTQKFWALRFVLCNGQGL